jgi:D-sedoheptulose 7-phosphate isomerase
MPQISSLISNSALISAVSNDISYDEVFKVILQRKARGGDLLIAISASGNSKNILKSLQWAKSEKIKTISILGFDGGLAQEMSDSSVVIMTELGEYGIVEDIHLSLCHAVAEEIITGFKD